MRQERTHLTLKDREELAFATGKLLGMADLAANPGLRELQADRLIEGLHEVSRALQALLARDLERRADG